MQVEIREGGDGVACWNADSITAYAAGVDEREARLAAANPDLVVSPGRIFCYGCEVLEYDMGTRCTAILTKTLYAVDGEVAPRKEDASASLSQIPGLLTRIDADPATREVPAPEPAAQPPRTGLLGLFGRRS
jgi:hypothetical protein